MDECLSRLGPARVETNRGMVPIVMAPSDATGYGSGRRGAVECAEGCVTARASSRGRLGRAPELARPPSGPPAPDSVAEAGDQVGEVRVGAVALGQDWPTFRGRPDARPRHADGRIVPGEAQLVGPVELVRHEIDELERLEG